QPLEYFDINDYGALWNPDWRLEGAARGGAGATYLDGEVLVTFPRDTRPCMLERTLKTPDGSPKLVLEVGYLPKRPWRLEVFADDDNLDTQLIGADGAPQWTTLSLVLSQYAGKTIKLRLYH